MTTNKNATSGKIVDLPADILRLLALYSDICDIIRICRLNKNLNNCLYQNHKFILSLGHQRLTKYDNRLANKNILFEIYSTGCLERATMAGYLERIKYLVKRDVDLPRLRDHLLISASKGSYLDIVKYLVSKGADVHTDDEESLIITVSNGNLNMVKYLIKHGANFHAQDDQALKEATIQGHL